MSTENTSISKTITIEFWVGIFVIIGLLSFSYLSINIAGMKFSNAGFYNIYAAFNDISGLKNGAPVEIAGVKIGEVVDINLKDTQALVKLQIKNNYELRDDDIFQIRTKGIIGDKFVKVSPGGSSTTIKEGDTIYDTNSAVDFEEIIGKFIYSLNKKDDKDDKESK